MIATDESDVQARIAATVNSNPIVLFMKGSPAFPLCGFSAAIVDILRRYEVTVHAVDVLGDSALRHGIKVYSDWPTIPQLYVGGAFIGGSDIVREMHETGELGQVLAAVRIEATS